MTLLRTLRERTLLKLALAVVIAVAAAVGLLLKTAPEASGAPGPRFADVSRTGAQLASGELIVSYAPGATVPRALRVNRRLEAKTREVIPQLNARVLTFPDIKKKDSRAARLRAMKRTKRAYERNPIVDVVDYNYRHHSTRSRIARTKGGGSFGGPWALRQIGANKAWNITRGGGAEIAVIDTGIDATHPDLQNRVIAQHDFVDGDSFAEDTIGHGTHVAGIAAASRDGQPGLGVCPSCNLIAAKVTRDDGTAYDSTVASAITWSVDRGADVINISMVSGGRSKILQRAIEYAYKQDALVVSAAGNENTDARMYPTSYPNVLSVSGTDETDTRLPESNYGSWIDVAAPGQGILSTVPGNSYAYQDGTSMSCAFATGVAGLLVSQGLTAPEIHNKIEATALDVGPRGRDPYYGAGRLDAAAAVGAAEIKPRITAVDAKSPTAGKDLAFTVEGSGLQAGARVLLKGGSRTVEASPVDVSFTTTITTRAAIPSSASGETLDVVVVNPDGQRVRYPDAIEVE